MSAKLQVQPFRAKACASSAGVLASTLMVWSGFEGRNRLIVEIFQWTVRIGQTSGCYIVAYHFRCGFACPMPCLGVNMGHQRIGLSRATPKFALECGYEFERVEWDNMVVMVCCQDQNGWVLS